MNSSLPSGWQGRCLALALLLLLLAATYLAVAAPLLEFYSERSLLAQSRTALLRKLDVVGAELPALHARVAKLSVAMDSHKLTLDGASDAIAAARLQGRIEPLATGSGMTIGSTEILTSEAQGDYRRIGLRLIVSGSYESLLKLLAAVEKATPPLVVDNLQIRSLQHRLGNRQLRGLDASFDVFGFRAADTTAAATP